MSLVRAWSQQKVYGLDRFQGSDPTGPAPKTGHISAGLPSDRPLRIWIVNHYADPPDGLATRTFDLARHMVLRGNEVTILASNFSHYLFKHRHHIPGVAQWVVEDLESVRIVWVRATEYHDNGWRRVLNMATFAIRSFIWGLGVREQPDVVIGVSVHPLAAEAGYWIAKIRRATFYCEITDLWPQTLIDFGRIRQTSITARLMRAWERHIYLGSKRIFMLWRNTAPYVESLGVDSRKIVWIPHGVDPNRYRTLERYEGEISGDFRVMFVGGFVPANAVDTILEVAAVLQRRKQVRCRFILVGAGQQSDELFELARKLNLRNLEFHDPVPKKDIVTVMNQADAFIYCLKDLPLYRFGASLNKVTDYLAAGRPIVFVGRSTYDPVAESGAGFSVPAGAVEAAADAIEKLIELGPERRAEMGRRAQAFLRANHTIPVLAEKVLATLRDS